MSQSFPSLSAAYAWLDGQINYERTLNHLAYNNRVFELEAFRDRMRALGDPQRGMRTIHIAGSRGKGSAAAAIDALLQASGLSTARYTSPHLHEYRERIALNGEPLAPQVFSRLLEQVAYHKSQPLNNENKSVPFKTVFEHLTALFFLVAREAHAEWSVVETGLGGRLDATNVLDPGPVLLTRIALEHTQLLGNTLAEIAGEKAAILKEDGWAIAGAQASVPIEASEAGKVFAFHAARKNAPLFWAEQIAPLRRLNASSSGLELEFKFENVPFPLNLKVFGTYQAENLQNALAMISELRRQKMIPVVSHAKLIDALEYIHFPGRMEFIHHNPDVLIDGAHCPAGAAALAQAMEAHFGNKPAVAAVAMLADKDHGAFFRELARWTFWSEILCYSTTSPRALPANDLARQARLHFKRVRVIEHFANLFELAAKKNRKDSIDRRHRLTS